MRPTKIYYWRKIFETRGFLINKSDICSTCSFYKQHFTSSTWLKLAKNQVKPKQHHKSELLLFENFSLSSSTLPSKNNWRYSKKFTKNKCVCFNEVISLMTTKMRLKKKSRSHKYDINRPRPRYRHEYTKYKMCLNIIMVICINLFVPNAPFLYPLKTSENLREGVHWERMGQATIEAQFMKKLRNTEAELKKSVAYKNNVYLLKNVGK